ncbi:14316_t:CDS:2 [Gigaspora margarita]|uniref:14316_t:CDS:1 n=1 Tax=Gigaspora margarita TaxID=4874 RepID=A0ABN7VMK3_GIGMA|nr:14316_t:CDS:2 [Gigaspora margarita]
MVEIEDVMKHRAIQAKNWPLTNKNNLLAMALICTCVNDDSKYEDRIMVTSQLEEITTDIDVQHWFKDTYLLIMDRVPVMKTSNELIKELFRNKNIA